MPGRQKSMIGTVVSDKMDKTVVVVIQRTTRHRLYRKILKRSKRFLAHDDQLEAKLGDVVRILETRPLSRLKRWRVAEIIKRGEVAEVAPREIDSEYLGQPKERAAEAEAVAEAPAAEPTSEPEAEAADEAADEPAAEPEATTEEPAQAEEPAAKEEAEKPVDDEKPAGEAPEEREEP